jgi:hypothetical protein
MASPAHGGIGDFSYAPQRGHANATGCVVDYIVDLDTVVWGPVLLHPFSWRKLHPGDAELCHEIRKLDPIRDVQRLPLFGGIAIKGNRVSGWTRADALQNSTFSFLRDLGRLDFCGLFQEALGEQTQLRSLGAVALGALSLAFRRL